MLSTISLRASSSSVTIFAQPKIVPTVDFNGSLRVPHLTVFKCTDFEASVPSRNRYVAVSLSGLVSAAVCTAAQSTLSGNGSSRLGPRKQLWFSDLEKCKPMISVNLKARTVGRLYGPLCGLHCLFEADQREEDMFNDAFVTRSCSLAYVNAGTYLQLPIS